MLSDTAVEAYQDEQFELFAKLGPVYDILRHPNTKTPLAIAIYGDWGTGKTTAMRVLQSMLKKWNEEGEAKDKVLVRPVWFDPWKYSEREDVWRGLIAEVIIESTKIENIDERQLITAAKQFSGFLGRGFLHALAGLKLKAKAGTSGTGVEAEYSFSTLREIGEEFTKTAHPEKAYLNEFESTLKKWLEDTLGKDGKKRMVVFVDDLDRCLPKVALEVLEAFKLYLSMPNLAFVFGLDRTVVDDFIKKHYLEHGVKEIKAKKYLDKMFQVEINITPSEKQVNEYYEKQISELNKLTEEGYWDSKLSEDHRNILDQILRRYSAHNPREVKRLLNSALIHGASAMQIPGANEMTRFAQGVQVFLLMKVLDSFHEVPGVWVGKQEGQDFFNQWSKIVKEHPEIKPPPVPMVDKTLKSVEDEATEEEGLAEVHPPYQAFYETWMKLGRKQLSDLVQGPYLWELMHIEFSREVASHTAALTVAKPEPAPPPPAMPPVIAKAVARTLEKPSEELTLEEYMNLKNLDLSGTDISDLPHLKVLSSLQILDLSDTNITDLSPLQELTRLEYLSLYDTKVSDLSPLKSLSSLKYLALWNTNVSDISPLKELTSLKILSLWNTKVADLSPLQGLNNLQELSVNITTVFDISPLQGLTSLQHLNLSRTKVADLSPLKGLANLQELNLGKTKVTDLSPLRGLKSLQILTLYSIALTDLSPLKGLTSLKKLDLTGTQVSDISPLKELISLKELNLNVTQVSDLSSLKGLTSLKKLSLRNTNVDQEKVDELQQVLPNLRIDSTPVEIL
ncbi:MAG: hypothetical protein A2V67_17515 [Deltaproteobacteria bacterium RBG_13_61_14]|nr:MAG: hypothetical protein A2V67_17515 [Deltaproteobacteria bacterium RBG_13_61_14]